MRLTSMLQVPRVGLVLFMALAMLGCSTTRLPEPATPEPPLPAERFSEVYDVVLLPTEEFSFDFAANLAKVLAGDTQLRVRAVLNLGTRDWKPYANTSQYNPAQLRDQALPAIAELRRTYGGSLYIVLTTRDLNNSSGKLRFVFAESYPQDGVSVISAARMLSAPNGNQASIQAVGERLRKMTLRTIGLLYFGLPRSADPRDLMYSPLMSLDALDRLEPKLRL
jgi:predicted Zn-dependent protease